jgi:diguanylate cyclase (GGDEF)-like protein
LELDTTTLRVSFAMVGLTLLVLFYFVAYRTSRSAYCGWWCVALGLFLAGSAAYLLDGTSQQVWANPLGSTLLVAGACSVWAGARALKGLPVPWIPFVGAPTATVIAAALDSPSTNEWAGGGLFLASMSLMVGLASRELWCLRPTSADLLRRGTAFTPAVRTLAVMSGAFSVFYAARTVVYLAVGPDGRAFERYLGSEVTTLVTTVLLAAVSFGMTSLSYERETEELRTRATRDGLTGLLNRTEFMRQASAEWRAADRGAMASLILADLDFFKAVNDTYGHPAGDYALQAFAAACRGAVRSSDIVGRYGGEEFIIFLPDLPTSRAEQIALRISERLRETATPNGMPFPTVSYGIAAADGADLSGAIERADRALYEAKSLGRDRVILSVDDDPVTA